MIQYIPSLPEVSHRGIFDMKGSSSEVTTSQTTESLFGIFLIFELAIHVSKHMLVQVIAHMQLFDLSIGSGELCIHIFVKLVKLGLLDMIMHVIILQWFSDP